MKKLVIACGGTGGHLFPALAVAECYMLGGHKERDVLFVGVEDRVFENSLSRHPYPRRTISSGKLHGGGWTGRLKGVWSMWKGIHGAKRILDEYRPDAVLGMGGYAQVPTLVAARLARIPTALHEQNAVGGRANILLSRLASRVFLSYEGSTRGFPAGNTVFTGLPVRRSFFEHSALSTQHSALFCVLVLGGSQGAYFLNRLMADMVEKLGAAARRFRFIHQTGEGDYPWVLQAYRGRGVTCEVAPFFHDTDRVLREAQLVIARAGASTVGELAAVGRGALLVPYPFAVKDHQFANAREMAVRGAAQVYRQEEMTVDKIVSILSFYFEHPEKACEMGRKAREMARPDAAARVCAELMELVGRRAPGELI